MSMRQKRRDFNLDVKEVSDGGEFSGYASVYDVIDAYREIVAPGAFTNSLHKWSSKGRLPPVLWQHRAGEPVGPFTLMREDEKGLYVEGRLLVDEVQRAREARALMKSKAVSGMSIGFNVVNEEYDSKNRLLTLKEIDLWEVSIVTFPANEAAQIEMVKNHFAGGMPNVRDFEDFLREAGFSKSHAAAIATHGLGRLLREAEGQNKGGIDAKSILEELSKPRPISLEEIFK